MFITCSLPVADGALVGQGDRAALLDLLARQHASGRLDGFDDHEAFAIEPLDFGLAWDALVREGLAEARGALVITPDGLARHAAADWAVAALAAAIDARTARAA